MKLIQKIAVYYLVAMGLVGLGIAIAMYEIFPYRLIRNVEDFIVGHDLGNKTTITEKIANDIGLTPNRFLRKYPTSAAVGTTALKIPGVRSRREEPLMFVDPSHREGYRAIFGAFDFADAFWGGVLLGPDGELLHTWKLSTEHISEVPEDQKNLYGLHLYADGSVIFTQQEEANGIVKVDACSNVVWNRLGSYHHTISATDDGSFWTFAGNQMDTEHTIVRISAETGEPLQSIDMSEVRKKNPFVHIFQLQKHIETPDASHGNDIDPLHAAWAGEFESFDADDLLISYRTPNLVFVLDPEDLQVKWWRVGAWDRQHDPDWESDGTISVFSNNEMADRTYSDIISIDPQTFAHYTVLDGQQFDLYSEINGDHERSVFNTRMVTSTAQGWAFEVNDDGEIVFSFVNNYDGDNRRSLNISEAYRLQDDYFDTEFWKQCSN